MRVRELFLATAFAVLGSVAAAATQPPSFLLEADDGVAGDLFGSSLAFSQYGLVVGAPGANSSHGAAYLFGGGENAIKLDPGDLGAGARFGSSVAIYGSVAVVGAIGSGGVYIFDFETGSLIEKFEDGLEVGIGTSVAVSENLVLFGAPESGDPLDPTGGSVYVTSLDGTFFDLAAPDDGTVGDGFGASVASNGYAFIVGAPGVDAAYIFAEHTVEQFYKLTPGDTEDNSVGFGRSVALSDFGADPSASPTAIVGASGSAYLFDLVTGEQIAKLTVADNPDLVVYDVAILGDTAFVADYSDDNGTGTVYVFDVVTGEQVFKLTGPDAAVGALFGSSLAATDNFLLVGSSGRNSDTGAVYLYGAGGEVPLPASVWLLGSAFVLLGLRRRRAGARA
jgi:hypothetical protein